MRCLRSLLLLSLILISCDRTDSNLMDTVARTRSDEIHEQLVRELRARYPRDENTVWSDTRLSLKDDWLLQSPEDLWDALPEEIPSLDCDTKNVSCEPNFRRSYCEADGDCPALSRCEVMDALSTSPSDLEVKLCVGQGDRLLNKVYRVVVSAEHELDFASLSLPTGRFRLALVNALSHLSQKENVPSVRLLFSGAVSALPEFLHPARKALSDLLAEVERKSPSADRLKANLTWISPGNFSWNHTKIIVADGQRAITGGHNLWDDDYLKEAPVFDVSMEFEGDAASASRDYLNKLWSYAHRFADYPTGTGRLKDFAIKAPSKGNVRALSVGRLGSLGSNPSDSVLKSLMDNAKTSIFLSQQDIFNEFVSPLTQSFAYDNIITAAVRGVRIEFVQSSQGSLLTGYGSVGGTIAYKAMIDSVSSRLKLVSGLSEAQARLKACDTIKLATFRFAKDLETWPGSNKKISNHAKVIMVDDAAFYIGSQNLYPANLQEHGLIVTDQGAAAALRAEYWDKLWAASGPSAYPCPL